MQNTPNYKLNKPDGNDYAKIESLNANADIIDTELKKRETALSNVTEQLEQIKPKVDNSWQLRKYNDTSISNLGKHTAERVLYISSSDWKATGNVEQLDIYLPFADSFSGLIKATYTSFWGVTDSSGGATVLYRFGNYSGTAGTRLNDYVLETITPDFARNYYIHTPYIDSNTNNIILMVQKAPNANNPFIIKLELQGVRAGDKDAFTVMNNVYLDIRDNGSPTHNGYPWIPQYGAIPSAAKINEWDRKSDSIAFDKSNGTSYPDPNTFLDTVFITNHANAQSMGESRFWYIEQVFYGGNGASNSRSQFARSYSHGNSDMKVRHFYADTGWSEWSPSIQQLFTSVSNGKSQVANAITQKGVPTSADAEFATMANNIRAIQTIGGASGNGTANGAGYTTTFSATGLAFQPRVINIYSSNGGARIIYNPMVSYQADVFTFDVGTQRWHNYAGANVQILPSGFVISVPVDLTGSYRWEAFK